MRKNLLEICSFVIILFLGAIAFSGCSGVKTVKRDPWRLNMGEEVVIKHKDKKLLEVNPRGTVWKWHTKPEEVVTALIELSFGIEQKAREVIHAERIKTDNKVRELEEMINDGK